MNVKYQIFVSSTFEDLQEERRVLMQQILNLGHIPVGMELFQAANQEQWLYIEKRIRDCDYYLLIVAERYGSVDETGKSFTQKEYEYAVSIGVPVAAFLLSTSARKTRRADFVEHPRLGEIDAFRKLCSQKKMVSFWSDPSDLALKATNSLLGLIENEPRQGWVRADPASEGALRELAKLAEDKRILESRLGEFEAMKSDAVPDDVKYHMDKMQTLTVSSFVKDADAVAQFVPVSLLDLFVKISRKLSSPITTNAAYNLIYKACDAKGGSAYASPFAREIIEEYAAYGIISITGMFTGDRVRSDATLTDYGKRLLMFAERALEATWEQQETNGRQQSLGSHP